MLIFPYLLDEGRFMRRLEVEQVRRPRAGDETYPPHPGGAGAPPGTTMSPCEELADGGRLGRPSRSAASPVEGGGNEGPKGTPRAEPKARPGAVRKTPPWSAGRRPRPSKEDADRRNDGRASRRSIPLAVRGGRREAPLRRGRDDGLPGAVKEYGR